MDKLYHTSKATLSFSGENNYVFRNLLVNLLQIETDNNNGLVENALVQKGQHTVRKMCRHHNNRHFVIQEYSNSGIVTVAGNNNLDEMPNSNVLLAELGMVGLEFHVHVDYGLNHYGQTPTLVLSAIWAGTMLLLEVPGLANCLPGPHSGNNVRRHKLIVTIDANRI